MNKIKVIVLMLLTITVVKAQKTDHQILEELLHNTCKFYQMLRADNGLYFDFVSAQEHSNVVGSTASIGMGLVAQCVATEMGWTTSAEEEIIETLKSVLGENDNGIRLDRTAENCFIHFYDIETGRAKGKDWSPIDTDLLLGGALFAKRYFNTNSEITKYADQLFKMVNHELFIGDITKGQVSLLMNKDGSATGNDAINSEELDTFLRHWLGKRGVVSIGVTEMKNYHWYRKGGRGDRYGKEISPGLPLGIAFTVEMDDAMVGCAPYSPIVMESAQQYLNAGTIAVQMAAFLRNLGYEARAHIDGNYEVVCPLVARDAGLGEIGRMGLLMTPQLGPRVRLAVVTTNAPLKTDKRGFDSSVEDFCSKCLKCADTCPSSAISFDGKSKIGNVKRWQIDSEKCFTYWCSTGTDCGRCISVCPYSHPNNLFHNSVRFMIKHFPKFRKPAVMLDDFFYGRKPKPQKLPRWLG